MTADNTVITASFDKFDYTDTETNPKFIPILVGKDLLWQTEDGGSYAEGANSLKSLSFVLSNYDDMRDVTGSNSPYWQLAFDNLEFGFGEESTSWTMAESANYATFIREAPSATPEPATMLIFGVGTLVGYSTLRFRKKRAK
ncbi:MAG: PEP-CTERM sorting domain-containing protein [Planctomycetaceae bacterium]|nr:PEP-CTERM sorting domain-containing protein [Planctomycetaceae bacterium]